MALHYHKRDDNIKIYQFDLNYCQFARFHLRTESFLDTFRKCITKTLHFNRIGKFKN